jgi:hypothetical protein
MKFSPAKENIVSDGSLLIRASEEYKCKENEIRKSISERCRDEWFRTSWRRRPFLKWKMERQVQKELDEIAPPHGLYIVSK